MPKSKKSKAKSTSTRKGSAASRRKPSAKKGVKRSARASAAKKSKPKAKSPRPSTRKKAVAKRKAPAKRARVAASSKRSRAKAPQKKAAPKGRKKATKVPARRPASKVLRATPSISTSAPRLVRAPVEAKPATPAPLAVKPVVPVAAPRAVVAPPMRLAPPAPVPRAAEFKRAALRGEPSASTWQRVDDLARRLEQTPLSPELRQAVGAALAGKDALAIVHEARDAALVALTAGPHVQEPSLFVSPSAAALRAAEDRAGKAGIPAVRFDAGTPAAERARVLARIQKGGPLLVLLGPAEVRLRELEKAWSRTGIGLAVIDEAHTASSLTHELCPSLSALGATLARLGRPPLVAITRPLSLAARHDLIDRLGLRKPVSCEAPLVRDRVSLSTHVARGEVRQARLVELLQQLPPPGVIFCALPHDVDAVYAGLAAMRLAAHRHHPGLAAEERRRELEAWSAPNRRAILVATSGFSSPSGALGLGEEQDPWLAGFGRHVPRNDVRFVIHYQAPPSLDQYLREIAFAGRDGQRADAVLLYESAHRSLNDALLAQQRFRPQHLLDLARALESAAIEGKPLTVEALALSSGQSRRTMDRLTALLADAGLVEKVAGWVRPAVSGAELSEGCRALAARLSDLRAGDARRLEALTEYAETTSCRLVNLSRAFGLDQSRCGRCSACAPVSGERSAPNAAPNAPLRRPAVHTFSVSPVPITAPEERRATPLTAKMADFAGR